MPSPRRHVTWKSRAATVAALSTAGLAALGQGAFAATPEAGGSSYTASNDPYSMAATATGLGAGAWWANGYTGQGVDVAVIDTGVAPVPGLSGAGKVVQGPDLSFESQNPSIGGIDTNGHGTFMAGLIAGNDPTNGYSGIAPGARVVALKVGAADGGADVSQVVAAINWVVANKNANGMNIRVINLSYSTWSTQSASVDPIANAVEQAYKAGILVVAAAGNVTGPQTSSSGSGLADPAFDPTTLAVGAADTNGTAGYGDDVVASYSATAPNNGTRTPDLVAPGSHLQGLRVPGSSIDLNNTSARLGSLWFRGSGTSEATAITSGAAALVLSKYPSLTPDQVKAFLESKAVQLTSTGSKAAGRGELNLAALASATPSTNVATSSAPANGSGSLESARGGVHVTSPSGAQLTGEQDIFGHAYSATAAWSGNSYNGSTWIGTWGSAWDGSSFLAAGATGAAWSGTTWSGTTWSGTTWSGTTWSGTTWSGTTWSAGSWA